MILDPENVKLLRLLCEGVLPEDRIVKLTEELTDDELYKRLESLRHGIRAEGDRRRRLF